MDKDNELLGDEADNPICLTPFIGMTFSSEEDTYGYYNDYGRRQGFSVRKSTTRYNKDKTLVAKLYSCSKEGNRVQNSELQGNSKVEFAHTRCGCNALMEVRMDKIGTWKVTKFIEEHNHELVTPTKRNLLRSQHKLTKATVSLIQKFEESGLRTRNILNVFAEQSNGYGNVAITEDAIRRTIREYASQVYGNDGNLLYEYFEKKTQQNPDFFYCIQVDGGQMLNCFWVDAQSRIDYYHFGDVVVFDTTYKTNKYLMPFCPFTGVNHHRQSIMFGCGLLVDETIASFEWMFSKWLEAMGGRHPKAIITDQDERMGVAIAKFFPNTTHRLCMWHIMQKLPEKVPQRCYEIGLFDKDLEKCIYHSLTLEEFECSWDELNKRYNVQDIRWLSYMYEIREKWMPVYFRKTFLAGMSTTQRSESMNKFFKDYVDKFTPLSKFVVAYDKALEYRRVKENKQQFDTIDSTPIYKTPSLLERHMAKVFTRKIFKLFQMELWESYGYTTNMVGQEGDISNYKVFSHKTGERVFLVTYIGAEKRANCLCCKFEFEGIVYRHIFAVISSQVINLPSHFILRRWTRDAKQGVVQNSSGVAMRGDIDNCRVVRYNEICARVTQVASIGSISSLSYKIAIEGLANLVAEIQNASKEDSVEATVDVNVPTIVQEEITKGSQVASSCSIKAPPIVHTKGSGKRFQSGRERRRHWQKKGHNIQDCASEGNIVETEKRQRMCHTCYGYGHDTRTCHLPNKKARMTSDIQTANSSGL